MSGSRSFKEYELPPFISEIHLGFLSGKHYVGRTNVGYCRKLEIMFDATASEGQWRIKAEWVDKDKNVIVSEKSYNKRLRKFGIHERQIPPNISKE